ncbi:hypothetical protein AAFF_G00351720 [Aldrovandia affinis]|uniref:Uncharacterized protein n=1 Tax=Aldrovandia affinis TaxID=143900 RepID=A0AAD7SIR8_9TELE|nr:hypothetical protein AAFF_G00351720 [Aldrovandia affinis]
MWSVSQCDFQISVGSKFTAGIWPRDLNLNILTAQWRDVQPSNRWDWERESGELTWIMSTYVARRGLGDVTAPGRPSHCTGTRGRGRLERPFRQSMYGLLPDSDKQKAFRAWTGETERGGRGK